MSAAFLFAFVLPFATTFSAQDGKATTQDARTARAQDSATPAVHDGARYQSQSGGWSIAPEHWETITDAPGLEHLRASLGGWPAGQQIVDLLGHEVAQGHTTVFHPKAAPALCFVAVTTLPQQPPTTERLRDAGHANAVREGLRQRMTAITGAKELRFQEPAPVTIDGVPSLDLAGQVVDAASKTLTTWDTRIVPGHDRVFRIESFAAPSNAEQSNEQVTTLLATFDGAEAHGGDTHWLALAGPYVLVILVAFLVLALGRSYRNSRAMRRLPPVQEPK